MKYIYAQRCKKKPINFHELEAQFILTENIEKYIAIKNSKVSQHTNKWCNKTRTPAELSTSDYVLTYLDNIQ